MPDKFNVLVQYNTMSLFLAQEAHNVVVYKWIFRLKHGSAAHYSLQARLQRKTFINVQDQTAIIKLIIVKPFYQLQSCMASPHVNWIWTMSFSTTPSIKLFLWPNQQDLLIKFHSHICKLYNLFMDLNMPHEFGSVN